MSKGKSGKQKPRPQSEKKTKPWLEDKIKAIRKTAEHTASRAVGRFGAPAGVALVILLTFISLFSPKNEFQQAQGRLTKNPQDLEAHLILAEEFLKNNQFEEAEQILLLAQQTEKLKNPKTEKQENTILGSETNMRLEKLWERKISSDPEDIKRLIAAWEKILAEKPNYRDGYLQLASLHYQIYEDKKAKEALLKALELDPNFEPARELEKVIGN